MTRGVRLKGTDLTEVIDLYRWGARMRDLEMLYGYHRQTIRTALKMYGVKMRSPFAPTVANPKPHSAKGRIKSSRPPIPAGAQFDDALPTPDQLLRSSAHAQQDRRTAERLSDANTGSCPGEAFECRYAFLRNGSRLPDLE